MRHWTWWMVGVALAVLPGAGLAQTEPLAELSRLKQTTNAGRLAALQEILTERKIPFEAQAFAHHVGPCAGPSAGQGRRRQQRVGLRVAAARASE